MKTESDRGKDGSNGGGLGIVERRAGRRTYPLAEGRVERHLPQHSKRGAISDGQTPRVLPRGQNSVLRPSHYIGNPHQQQGSAGNGVRVKGKQGENSPADCFCRRARARQGVRGAGLCFAPLATMLASRRGTRPPVWFKSDARTNREGAPKMGRPLCWCGLKDLNLHNLAVIRT